VGNRGSGALAGSVFRGGGNPSPTQHPPIQRNQGPPGPTRNFGTRFPGRRQGKAGPPPPQVFQVTEKAKAVSGGLAGDSRPGGGPAVQAKLPEGGGRPRRFSGGPPREPKTCCRTKKTCWGREAAKGPEPGPGGQFGAVFGRVQGGDAQGRVSAGAQGARLDWHPKRAGGGRTVLTKGLDRGRSNIEGGGEGKGQAGGRPRVRKNLRRSRDGGRGEQGRAGSERQGTGGGGASRLNYWPRGAGMRGWKYAREFKGSGGPVGKSKDSRPGGARPENSGLSKRRERAAAKSRIFCLKGPVSGAGRTKITSPEGGQGE